MTEENSALVQTLTLSEAELNKIDRLILPLFTPGQETGKILVGHAVPFPDGYVMRADVVDQNRPRLIVSLLDPAGNLVESEEPARFDQHDVLGAYFFPGHTLHIEVGA